MELAQYRSLEPVGFTAEVAKTCRGLRANHGDPDEFNWCRELLVAGIKPSLLEVLPDPGEFGGKVTEGVRRVHAFDDQVQAIEGIEPDFRQAEDLDIGFESLAGGSLELGGDGLCSGLPDDPLCLSENVTLVVPLAQCEIEVSVLAT